MYFFRYLRSAGLLPLLLPLTLHAAMAPATEECQERHLYNPLVAFIGCSRYEEPNDNASSMPHLDQVPSLLESLSQGLKNNYSYVCHILQDREDNVSRETEEIHSFLEKLNREINKESTDYDGLIVVAMGYGEEKQSRSKKGGGYFTMVLPNEDDYNLQKKLPTMFSSLQDPILYLDMLEPLQEMPPRSPLLFPAPTGDQGNFYHFVLPMGCFEQLGQQLQELTCLDMSCQEILDQAYQATQEEQPAPMTHDQAAPPIYLRPSFFPLPDAAVTVPLTDGTQFVLLVAPPSQALIDATQIARLSEQLQVLGSQPPLVLPTDSEAGYKEALQGFGALSQHVVAVVVGSSHVASNEESGKQMLRFNDGNTYSMDALHQDLAIQWGASAHRITTLAQIPHVTLVDLTTLEGSGATDIFEVSRDLHYTNLQTIRMNRPNSGQLATRLCITLSAKQANAQETGQYLAPTLLQQAIEEASQASLFEQYKGWQSYMVGSKSLISLLYMVPMPFLLYRHFNSSAGKGDGVEAMPSSTVAMQALQYTLSGYLLLTGCQGIYEVHTTPFLEEACFAYRIATDPDDYALLQQAIPSPWLS